MEERLRSKMSRPLMVDTVCAPGDSSSAIAAMMLSSVTIRHSDFEDELRVLVTMDQSLCILDVEDRLRETSQSLMVDTVCAPGLVGCSIREMTDLGRLAWSHCCCFLLYSDDRQEWRTDSQ